MLSSWSSSRSLADAAHPIAAVFTIDGFSTEVRWATTRRICLTCEKGTWSQDSNWRRAFYIDWNKKKVTRVGKEPQAKC